MEGVDKFYSNFFSGLPLLSNAKTRSISAEKEVREDVG
jgi:hypothetical protein